MAPDLDFDAPSPSESDDDAPAVEQNQKLLWFMCYRTLYRSFISKQLNRFTVFKYATLYNKIMTKCFSNLEKKSISFSTSHPKRTNRPAVQFCGRRKYWLCNLNFC